jgi:adenylate cyclase
VTGPALEIERKFLVADRSVLAGSPTIDITQVYVFDDGRTVMRLNRRDGEYRLTLRENTADVVRQQFACAIPETFGKLLAASPMARVSVKRRHLLRHGDLLWTVDVWSWPDNDLALAEVELADPATRIDVPPWCGREVTGDPAYYDHVIAAPRPTPPAPGR